MDRPSVVTPGWQAGAAGMLTAGAALSASVLLDGLSAGIPSLILAVGQLVIRGVPGALARGGVELAGFADKPLVVAGTVVLALAIGWRLGRSTRVGDRAMPIGLVVFGVIGFLAAAFGPASAPEAGSLFAAVGAVATGLVVHRLLVGAIGRESDAPEEHAPEKSTWPGEVPGQRQSSRRGFLVAGSLVVAGSAAAIGAGRFLGRGAVAAAQRAAIVLPRARRVEVVPVGAGLDAAVPGISPLITPTADFYRIDEALFVPNVDVDSWQLEVKGMVDTPLRLSYADLLAMPMVERPVTIACVSNEVGGDLIGTAVWKGVLLADVLRAAGVDPKSDQLVGRSVDGFTVGFPTKVALDGRDALIAVGMNGEVLPAKHGFPARLVVPGLYGYVSATKWLSELELTRFERFDPYWIERGWSRLAPIKTQSRIDVPRSGAQVKAGTGVVAGVAWAQPRGIEAVDIRVDGGPWMPATLGEALNDDTWRQWRVEWTATRGRHLIEVRATDGKDDPQDERQRPVFPDGATGYHRVNVDVEA